MQYQLADGKTTVSFIRPAHALLVLHGGRVVPMNLLGLQANRLTQGHRFQGEAQISIDHADNYASIMHNKGAVIVDMDERKQAIHEALVRTRSLHHFLKKSRRLWSVVRCIAESLTKIF
ncbi:MAG: Glycine--tRNA ligase beta subunit [Pseudomonadota bacterium]